MKAEGPNDEKTELHEPCPEILENWHKPVCPNAGHNFANQSPLSRRRRRHHPYFDSLYPYIERDYIYSEDTGKLLEPLSSFNDVSKKTGNHGTGKDADVIQRLVADTFYDRLLGCCVDGVDAASLTTVKGATSADETKHRHFPVSNLHSSQDITPLYKYKCNIFGENRLVQATGIFPAKSRFTLPSYKTIFDLNIEHLGRKLWQNPGADMSDFFNFGLDEKQWKNYCKWVREQARMGSSRQGPITPDTVTQSHKEVGMLETNLASGKSKCFNSTNSKDQILSDTDVIIEVTPRESTYNQSVLASRKKPRISHRMINGDKISPLPSDSYSDQESYGSEIEIKVDGLVENNVLEDPGKVETRSESIIKLPFSTLRNNTVASTSMKSETNIIILRG